MKLSSFEKYFSFFKKNSNFKLEKILGPTCVPGPGSHLRPGSWVPPASRVLGPTCVPGPGSHLRPGSRVPPASWVPGPTCVLGPGSHLRPGSRVPPASWVLGPTCVPGHQIPVCLNASFPLLIFVSSGCYFSMYNLPSWYSNEF